MAQPILFGMVYGSIRTTYTILTLRLLDSDVSSSTPIAFANVTITDSDLPCERSFTLCI